MCKHALLSFSLVGWLVVLEYLQRMRWLAVTNRRNGILNGTTRKYSSTFLFLLHIFDAGNCALVYYTRALPLRSNMDRSQWKIHTYLKRDRIAQKTHRKPQTNKIICPTQAGWISQAHTAILPELDMAYMQWYWDTTTNTTLWYNNIFNENFPFKICLISTGAMKGGGFAVAGNTYKWHEANETNGATRVRRTQNEQRNQRMASATRIEFHHGIE